MNYFDCHADTLTKIPVSENLWENSGHLDLLRVSGFADKYTQIFALWKDRAQLTKDLEDSFMQLYKRAAALLEEQSAHAVWCTKAADMHKAHAKGKAAVFLSVEDISIMGSLAGRIKELGIRFALLTWNYENEYACGSAADQAKGLTKEGQRLVRQLLNENVVLDISHLSDRGTEDLFALTDRPVMASHSNVRDICMHPRNLKKEHIKELIRRKGLLGINFYKEFAGERIQTGLLRQIDAVLKLGGEDILAIGADFDGCSQFPEGITGVQSVPGFRDLLAREGFGADLLEKIFFGNAQKFLDANVC